MKLEFKVPAEQHPKSLEQLLRRAWVNATDDQVGRAFDQKQVRTNGRVSRDPSRIPCPGADITAEVGIGGEDAGLLEATELARGNHWVVVDKPVGMVGELDRDDPMNPVLYLADTLGLDRAAFTPAWPLAAAAGGPWLIGKDPDRANEIVDAWKAGELMITWVALVPTPGRAQGRLEAADGIAIDYSATRIRDDIAELQLTPMPQHAGQQGGQSIAAGPRVNPVEVLLDTLAAHHMPALGDAHRGGYMVDGGLRVRIAAAMWEEASLAHSWNPDGDWWPAEPVVDLPDWIEAVGDSSSAQRQRVPELLVSSTTMDVVTKGGHPWILADGQTGDRSHLTAGSAVQLVGPDGTPGPTALIEDTGAAGTASGTLAARVWSHDREAAEYFPREVDLRVDEALVRRAELISQTPDTDLFRLIHGQADRLPGLFIDRIGPLVRATLTGASAFGFRERVYQNFLDFDPDLMILEVEHLRDIRTEERPEAHIIEQGTAYVRPGQRVVGREDGLKYWCEPWDGIDVGFFADQRDNRRRLRDIAGKGQQWLNLFCHTGAFTVVLCDQGCQVVSNDLSARYLEWLDDNLRLNDLPLSMNTSIADDARAYLAGADKTFDGIIVDPPTAAAGSEGFWAVKDNYEDLLVDCFDLLAPGGTMLVCRNDKRPSAPLDQIAHRAARRADRLVAEIAEAPAAFDYPTLQGFPEGNSSEGLFVEMDSRDDI